MNRIPILNLVRQYEYMKEDIDLAIKKCLEHQNWILGPEIYELEKRMSEYLGIKHGIGVSSGTDALVLSLRALAIKLRGREYFDRDDEILTTPFTFTATGDAILRAGATPVFLDIDPVTFNIDPQKIKEYLSSNNPGSKSQVIGVIPVHLYGQACDMDEIMTIARLHKLFVIEDLAQAIGAKWNGNHLGSFGVSGGVSFFPSKNLGGFGDGGMVVTNDPEINELVRMLLKHGGKDKYNVDHIGYNARLDTIQAAVVLSKLKYLDEFNQRRGKIAEKYSQALKGIDELTLPFPPPARSAYHVYHQYTIKTKRRDALQDYLKQKGISTMVYYPVPLHKMGVFQGRMKISGNLIRAEQASSEVLSLPIEPLQREDETNFIISKIREFFL